MYRTDLDSRHKGGALAAVIAVHGALAFALLHLSGTVDIPLAQDALEVFDLDDVEPAPPPPPPPPPPPKQEVRENPKEREGGSAPKNIRSEPTPVVAPQPQIELPTPPVVATETPAQGADPTQGMSAERGPGTGAGGTGTGTGTGSGSGSGSGGGGGGGVAIPAGVLRGITGRDYPSAVRRSWPRGGQIFLRLRIEADGRPSQCDVMRSYGDPTADQLTCSLIMQRGVFRPAKDARGNPVSAWLGYVQSDRT